MANTTNWLNISSQSGSSGETILTLSAQRNLSTNYKTAEITAYNPVYNISAKTYVTIESYSPYIEVEPVIVGVPESGGTYQLSISSNCAYVIAYPDLVASYSTSAATGNTTITFSVTGTSADTTLVGNIVITDESGQVSKTVRVEQYGQGAQISYWPGYLNFPASGGSGNIGVSANCVYTVTKSEGADWFSVSPSSGYTGRTDFTVTMTGENTGSSPLSGYVFINGPGNAGGVVEIRQNAPETRLVVGYYVTSTVEPTVILVYRAMSAITTAEYPNGTQITPVTAYTFPSTGMQYVYYTVSGNAVPESFLDSVGSYTALSDTVRSVFIPNSYTGIGNYSFYKCSSLSSVTLGNGITVIDNTAFRGCTSLSSITLPESLQTIGENAFRACTSLTEIVIPSAVTSIGSNCFSGSSVETFYFSSPTPPTLGNTTALTSSNLQEIIVPCVYYNAYVAAWPQYEQYITCQDTELYFITDTSNVKGIGETRTITILNTNINPNRTGLNLPSDFPAQGSYVVDGNTIYLTYPANPSSSSTRTWTIGVVAQTNDGQSLSGSYQITQNALQIVPIPYTADTSIVDASGETRTITIDTSGLVESSITISVEGATGVTTTYQNGVITVVFPENQGNEREITITIDAITTGGNTAKATIVYFQESGSGILGQYLTFRISGNGDIVWKTPHSSTTRTISYKKNENSWVSISPTTSGTSFSVQQGDIVLFRGTNVNYYGCTFCGTTATFSVDGNIMSLIDSTNFSSLTSFNAHNSVFPNLFKNCSGLTSAEHLCLPVLSIPTSCYAGMFCGCTSLTKAPVLPATAFTGNNNYAGMFSGCTSLTKAPALPATDLVMHCYNGMFRDCTSLTQPPQILPATTLKQYCYANMFYGCSSLTYTPSFTATSVNVMCCQYMFLDCSSLTQITIELQATTLSGFCYAGMFAGCSSLTTAPTLPATTLASSCYQNMFGNCTSLTTAPELPATSLAGSCYVSLFQGCSSLNYIKCLVTNLGSSADTWHWVSGVASSGTFVTPSSTNWTTDNDGIPTGWTRVDA